MTTLALGQAPSNTWRAASNAVRACAKLLLDPLLRSIEIQRRRRLLQQMPDYLLKDIGISRADIDYLAEALVDGREDPTRRPRN
jgi:uncharacterized protein YjiS (DUF1127 family)